MSSSAKRRVNYGTQRALRYIRYIRFISIRNRPRVTQPGPGRAGLGQTHRWLSCEGPAITRRAQGWPAGRSVAGRFYLATGGSLPARTGYLVAALRGRVGVSGRSGGEAWMGHVTCVSIQWRRREPDCRARMSLLTGCPTTE